MILCFGISHNTAPLSLLENFSFSGERMTGLLRDVCREGVVRGAAGLSTCNRTEFYIETEQPDAARQRLMECLAAAGPRVPVLAEHIFLHQDAEAVRHPLRVACGIDSLIVGEKQILGQLREALEIAESAGTAQGLVSALLQRAIRVGRRAHQETAISRGNVSVASVAVSIAQKVFSDLGRRKVLILGAGQTAKLALANLADNGIGSVVVANRTPGRAEELAEQFGGTARSLEGLQSVLGEVDIIVAATGSSEYLIRHEDVAAARPKGRTQVYLDLSMPRNIEPSIAGFHQVFLYGIEDLEGVAKENRGQREAEIGKVEAIIDEEVGKFLRWIAQSDSSRLVAALRRRVEQTRAVHLARFENQLPPEIHQRFDKFSQSLMKSVFHDLTNNLRRLDPKTEAGQLQYEMACRLLNLEERS